MIKNIPLWWFILLAWVLAMCGNGFWEINAAEWFATAAILLTAGCAIYKARKEKRRKDSLIVFPHDWFAHRNKGKGILDIHASVDIFLVYESFSYKGQVFIDGDKLPVKFEKPRQHHLNREKLIMSANIPLSEKLNSIEQLEVVLEINLDGNYKKKSDERILKILDIG